MFSPRVSVVCIFLDEEDFLAEAIDSVLAQDFADFELLLVDDGSTDGSAAIARDYAKRDPRVRLLEHPGRINRGMSASRNLGLAEARGEYITWIDGDDRMRPGKLTEQVALLEADERTGMVCGGYCRWDSWRGGSDSVYFSGPSASGVSMPPATTLSLYPLGWARNPPETMIRRSIALAVGGYEDSFTGLYEDQAFYAKAFLVTGVRFVERVWLDYRVHDGSCTSQIRWHQYVDTRRRFLDWFATYLAGQDVIGKEAILARLERERKLVGGLFLPWLRDRSERGWIRLQRMAGRGDRYVRHARAN